jgi:hypothetical protein
MPKGEKKAGGRPKTVKYYSEAVKKAYIKAAKAIEKETGRTIEEHYLRMSIDPDVQPAARAAFAKLYNEALLIKESEQTINDKRTGPTIGLPPIMEQPPKPKEAEEQRLHG